MKNWLLILGICVAGLGAVCFFTPLNQVVYDPAPSAEAMAATVVLDQPVLPLPPWAEVERQLAARRQQAGGQVGDVPLSPPEPLGRALVIVESVPAAVPQGAIVLPAGMPVELERDRGRVLDVRFGYRKQSATVSVPRAAVANRDVLEEPARGPLAVVRETVTGVSAVMYAPASSIAIEAKEVGTGRGVARGFDSWTGEIDRDYFRTKGLTVTVRNLSRRPTGEFEIRVYWTGRRLADNAVHVTHCETFRASVPGVAEYQETSWCPLLDSQVVTWDWNNERRVSGSKFDGWFVVVTRDDKMLVGRGATENYNSIIRDPTRLQPLLATWRGSSQRATADRPLWRHERPGKSAIPQDRRGGTPAIY